MSITYAVNRYPRGDPLKRSVVWMMVFSMSLVVASSAAAAETPKEAAGFWGKVTGSVKSAQTDGLSFVLTITTAEADTSKSTVKDSTAMVGKSVTLATRMPRKDGKPSPSEEDIAYIKTLKPGDKIAIKIFTVRGAPAVLRMQGPGEAVPPADSKK